MTQYTGIASDFQCFVVAAVFARSFASSHKPCRSSLSLFSCTTAGQSLAGSHLSSSLTPTSHLRRQSSPTMPRIVWSLCVPSASLPLMNTILLTIRASISGRHMFHSTLNTAGGWYTMAVPRCSGNLSVSIVSVAMDVLSGGWLKNEW